MSRHEDAAHDANEAARRAVIALCEREGFGFVMQQASQEWLRRDLDGACVVGPCAAFTKACGCKGRWCSKCYGCGWRFK